MARRRCGTCGCTSPTGALKPLPSPEEASHPLNLPQGSLLGAPGRGQAGRWPMCSTEPARRHFGWWPLGGLACCL